MTPEHYEAEMQRRMAEEGAKANAPTPSEGGDGASAHDAVLQAELARMQTNAAKPSETFGSRVQGVYNKGMAALPEDLRDDAKTAMEMTGGYLGGKALRSLATGIEPESVYGTPEYLRKQDFLSQAPDLEARAKIAEASINKTQADVGQATAQHNALGQNLKANVNSAAANHAAAENALRQAEQEHLLHSTINPNEEAERRLTGVQRQVLGNDGTGPGGNTGRQNQTGYNTRTAQEAARVNAASSALGAVGLNPSSALANAPDLASTESGLLIPKDVAAEQAQQKAQEEQLREQRRLQIAQQVAQEKAAAKLKFENAQKIEANARAALKQETDRLLKHAANPPSPAPDTTRHQETISDWQRMREKMPTKLDAALETVGRKILPRFVPGAGAAFAPLEFEQALKDYQQGKYLRAGIHGAGGLGALGQATGVPALMGAGDILQTPSVGLGLYDLANKP